MEKIVECVPNFSEGREEERIKEIRETIESVPGVNVLDVDPGEATNRTVFTFVGSPKGVKEAAFRVIKKASEIIDMRKHKGAHPRMGATDVCPFVPVQGISMGECAEIAKEVGEKVGKELGVPVYLYEEAASSEKRRSLAYLRKGEYESLPEKVGKLKPDFGPTKFDDKIAKTGATVIGAREFLIAYNINLNTKFKKLANKVAYEIREKGKKKKDKNGKIVKDRKGRTVYTPGKFKGVRAIGWYIDEYGIAQISINVLNYKKTPLWKIYEEATKQAQKYGLRVTGSEIVGLVPKKAIVDVGRYYINKQNRTTGRPEKEIIDFAIESMGLSSVAEFKQEEKIIEYIIEQQKKESLINRQVRDFVDEVSRKSPAPGGGSVAALSGSLAAALSSMVSILTYKKKKYSEHEKEHIELGTKSQEIKDRLKILVDEDTNAFNLLREAGKLPKKTKEQKEERKKVMEEATKYAAEVPLKIMSNCIEALKIADRVSEIGNINSISDVGVAGCMGKAGAEGAYLNVKINLSGIKDEKFKKEILQKADKKLEEAKKVEKRILSNTLKKIE